MRRKNGCVGISIDRAMIDSKNTSLHIEEGVWAWIGSTFDDILSKYNVTSRGLNDTRNHVSVYIGSVKLRQCKVSNVVSIRLIVTLTLVLLIVVLTLRLRV